jgi:hypothetical protein
MDSDGKNGMTVFGENICWIFEVDSVVFVDINIVPELNSIARIGSIDKPRYSEELVNTMSECDASVSSIRSETAHSLNPSPSIVFILVLVDISSTFLGWTMSSRKSSDNSCLPANSPSSGWISGKTTAILNVLDVGVWDWSSVIQFDMQFAT